MVLSTLLAIAVLAAAPAVPDTTTGTAEPQVRVTVDSVRSEVIVTAGPYDLENMPAGMDMSQMEHEAPQVMRFDWPVNGWLRGFRVEMRDAQGRELPREILHHLIGVNFDRRQLVYHSVERLFGWGSETSPVELPKSLGVPLKPGEKLGVYAMFHNETGHDIDAAYLRVILDYTPTRGNRLLAVMPFYVDVNNHIGGVTTFDIPPGKSSKSYQFELPISGKLVGIGGHLHDYGVAVMLQDAATGKVLARLKAQREKDGRVKGVGRFIFGFNSDALALEANHPYRVVAEYDNPTTDTIRDGAMGHINGAFAPDDMSKWPRLDPNDPLVQKDVAALPIMHDMNTGPRHTGAPGAAAGLKMKMKMDMPMDHTGHDAGHAPVKSDSLRPRTPR